MLDRLRWRSAEKGSSAAAFEGGAVGREVKEMRELKAYAVLYSAWCAALSGCRVGCSTYVALYAVRCARPLAPY
jgi:hypothetical protein